MKNSIGILGKEMWAIQGDEVKSSHEDLGSKGKLGIMRLMSRSFKSADLLRDYIECSINPDEAPLWEKELKKQERTRDFIQKHQPFNQYYNEVTQRNNVPRQPKLLTDIGLFLIGERTFQDLKQEANKETNSENQDNI